MSRLIIGDPRRRAKPPRGNPPCTEPIVYGANILSDPGIELQAANIGTGPLGYEIPMQNSGSTWRPFVWSDASEAPLATRFLADYFNGTDTYRWTLSTANPDAGTYHLRVVNDDLLYNYGNSVFLCDVKLCDSDKIASAMLRGGDYVKFTIRATATPVTDGPRLWVQVYFYNAADTYLGKAEPADWLYLTTSYQTFTVDGFAPAGSAYCLVFFNMTVDDINYGAGAVTHDVDTLILEVS